MRSALIGGLTASVGSAVAFYFSTKSSDNARQDLLNATVRTDTVPNLVGRTLKDATSTMGTTSFQLVVAPGPIAPTDTLLIKREDPATDSTIPKCSSVTVYFEDK